jgi:hypothetical protein
VGFQEVDFRYSLANLLRTNSTGTVPARFQVSESIHINYVEVNYILPATVRADLIWTFGVSQMIDATAATTYAEARQASRIVIRATGDNRPHTFEHGGSFRRGIRGFSGIGRDTLVNTWYVASVTLGGGVAATGAGAADVLGSVDLVFRLRVTLGDRLFV